MATGFVLLLLSIIGLLIAVIFYGVDHQKFPSLRKYAGFICDETVCSSVLRLDDSKLFWIKNYYWGIISYLVMIAASLLFLLTQNSVFIPVISVLSGLMLYTSVFLFVRLILIHKMKCVFCFTSHGLVLVIFLVSLF
jgi:uncharacterized membrane protein